jgi:hypothetical protein
MAVVLWMQCASLVRVFWCGGVAFAKFVLVMLHQAAGDLQGERAEIGVLCSGDEFG